jgi:hyperosmotically inducible periplasmic protein
MNILKNLLKFSRAVAVLALATFTITAYSASAATSRDQMTDEQLLSKHVRHALVTLPWYGVFDDLAYAMNGTEVTLSGQVTQPYIKYDAENAVKHVEGVTRVVDNISVLPLSRFDDQIRFAEYRAIFSEPELSRYSMGAIPSIHIIVNNGHVTLIGMVSNQMDANIARMRALSVPGVFSVTSNLRIG